MLARIDRFSQRLGRIDALVELAGRVESLEEAIREVALAVEKLALDRGQRRFRVRRRTRY